MDFTTKLLIATLFWIFIFWLFRRNKRKKKEASIPVWPDGSKLKYTVLRPTQILLEWPAAVDLSVAISGYAVYMGEELIANCDGNTLSCKVTGLTKGAKYVFSVKAKNAVGNWTISAIKATVTLKEKDKVKPEWPEDAAIVVKEKGKQLILQWPEATDNVGVTAYKIFVDDEEVEEVSGDTNSCTLKNLEEGKYEFRIEAGDRAKNWSDDGPVLIYTYKIKDTIAPRWPANAALDAITEGKKVRLEWPAAKDNLAVTAYSIFLDGEMIATVNADEFNYVIENAAAGNHTVEVKASDEAGNLSKGLSASVVIAEDALTIPSWPANAVLLITRENNDVKIQWPGMPDAAKIKQYRLFQDGTSMATVASRITSYLLSSVAIGKHTFSVQAGDGKNWGQSLEAEYIFTEKDTQSPAWPSDAQLKITARENSALVEWPKAADNSLVTQYLVLADKKTVASLHSTVLRFEIPLETGEHEIEVKAADAENNFSASLTGRVTLSPAATAPSWPAGAKLTLVAGADTRILVSWPAAQAGASAEITGYHLFMGEQLLTTVPASVLSYTSEKTDEGKEYIFKIEAVDSKGKLSPMLNASIRTAAGAPVYVAPPVDPTVSAPLDKNVEFIYSGENPMQVGLKPGTLDPHRVSVLRGRVKTRQNLPLEGVKISVQDHPEYGNAFTDKTGEFNLVVNGGVLQILNYEKAGFIRVQRSLQIAWEEIDWLSEVVMINKDSLVTKVDFKNGSALNSFSGSEMLDKDGKRKARVFFPAGTKASILNPDGTPRPMDLLNLRITEFTVGETGVKAMPGELPSNSGYTYALEITADEVDTKIDGKDVLFNQEVFLCVDNFLNFPIGSPAPAGYFDSQKAAWVPSQNGKVMKVLNASAKQAEVDLDGSGKAASAEALKTEGITETEREFYAQNFKAGDSFWRVPLTHFSFWDINWPFGPPAKAKPGGKSKKGGNKNPKNDCNKGGSIISVQSQTLGQEIPVGNSPFILVYKSNRVMGHIESRAIDLLLIEGAVPESLKAVEVEISVLGKEVKERFNAKADLEYRYVWDMKDGYNRDVHGTFKARTKIGYVYDGVYKQPDGSGSSFAQPSGVEITGSRTRNEVILWKTLEETIGLWNSVHQGLGGWTLNVHHFYDARSKKLYLGSGDVIDVNAIGQTISTCTGKGLAGFAGDGGKAVLAHIDTGQISQVNSKGTLLMADWGNHRIRQITPDGIITTVAGKGTNGFSGDGGPALKAEFSNPHRVVQGKNGTLYIADQGNNRIRFISSEGIVSTFAGTGNHGFSGDNGPATAAEINYPRCLTLDAEGSLYFSDCRNHRIRKIDPAGIITTVAGNGSSGYAGDGGMATAAELNQPQEIVIAKGIMYIADQGNHCIRKITPDGIITTVAGTGQSGYSGDGEPAVNAAMDTPEGIAVDKNGVLYIADQNNHCVRMVNAEGIISTFAGNGNSGNSGDNGSAINAELAEPHAIAIGHDGCIYISDVVNHNVRKISPPMLAMSSGDIMIPSEDGSEIYIFSGGGRHLKTLNSLTGAVKYSFLYNEKGLLVKIKDETADLLVMDRGKSGEVKLSDMYGNPTILNLDSAGYLSAALYTGNRKYEFGYRDGLMEKMKYPGGGTNYYAFDPGGKLISAKDAIGGEKKLERKRIEEGQVIVFTSAAGFRTEYQTINPPEGGEKKINVFPGNYRSVIQTKNGQKEIQLTDTTKIIESTSPDPRFGNLAPLQAERTRILAGGEKDIITYTKTVKLKNPANVLSVLSSEETHTLNGHVSTFRYEADKRSFSFNGQKGRTLVLLDQNWKVKELRTNDLHPVLFGYNPNGVLETISQGERNQRFEYNSLGLLSACHSATGHNTQFIYNAAGKIEKMTLPDNRESQYRYDPDGNVISVITFNGSVHELKYDEAGRLKTYTPPGKANKQDIQYSYDPDGRTKAINFGDRSIALNYNESGRPDTISQPAGITRLRYNDEGKLHSLTSSNKNEVVFEYAHGNISSILWKGELEFNYKELYDPETKTISLFLNENLFAYNKYSGEGMLTEIGDMTLLYDENKYLKGSVCGQLEEQILYNKYDELIASSYRFEDKEILTLKYVRDKEGRITEISETGRNTIQKQFSYDDSGRLSRVISNGNILEEYKYDQNDNRTVVIENGNIISNSVYNEQDQLINFNKATYQYDSFGAMKLKEEENVSSSYEYDLLGNLLVVNLNAKKKISYVIDGSNRRIGKKINGELTVGYIYNTESLLAGLTDKNGTLIATFIYGRNHIPELIKRDGKTYRIITDNNGSPRMVIDINSGEIIQEIKYNSFGKIISDTNPGFQPFAFAGGLFDSDIGLLRFGYRDYDPVIGRWTSKDPLLFSGGNLNLYAYCLNDPINRIDPDGLDSLFFDGNFLYHRDKSGKIIGSYPASAGDSRFDKTHYPKAPLPEGLYYFLPNEISHVEGWRFEQRNAYGDWGHFRVRLYRLANDKYWWRDDFFIHGGVKKGSAGCIDVGKKEYDFFSKMQQHKGPVFVGVKY